MWSDIKVAIGYIAVVALLVAFTIMTIRSVHWPELAITCEANINETVFTCDYFWKEGIWR